MCVCQRVPLQQAVHAFTGPRVEVATQDERGVSGGCPLRLLPRRQPLQRAAHLHPCTCVTTGRASENSARDHSSLGHALQFRQQMARLEQPQWISCCGSHVVPATSCTKRSRGGFVWSQSCSRMARQGHQEHAYVHTPLERSKRTNNTPPSSGQTHGPMPPLPNTEASPLPYMAASRQLQPPPKPTPPRPHNHTCSSTHSPG